VVKTALQAIDQRTTKSRPLLGENVDRLGNEVSRDRVDAAQFQEPCLDLRMQN
jgi:hypothetical protein